MSATEARTEQTSASRQTQMPGRGPAFRVSTASDFNPHTENDNAKRRNGLSTTACRMCRSRKVKCNVLSHASSQDSGRRCQACIQSDLECRWDTTDGRKRRKVHASRGTGNSAWSGHSQIVLLAEDRHQQETSTSAPLPTGEDSSWQTAPRDVEDQGSDWLLETRSPPHVVLPDPSGFFGGTVADRPQLTSPPSPWHLAHRLDQGSLESAGASLEWPEDVEDFFLSLGSFGVPDEVSFDVGRSRSLARTSTAQPKQIRLRIFRRYGPTAVAPGLNKLAIAVESCPDEASRSDLGPPGMVEVSHDTQQSASSHGSFGSQQDKSRDHFYGLPSETIQKVLGVFFEHFGGHFPFLNNKILAGHVHSKQASKFLINSILALTARFCSLDTSTPSSIRETDADWRRGAHFLKKAKEQLMSLLSVPAPDVVAGLVLLAWAEYGGNNEAGLWMFSGMAIRMAQDLGLHRSDATEPDPNAAFYDHAPLSPQGEGVLTDEQSALHQQKCRLVMFWSVFNMDVYVSLLMGRIPTIKRAEIEVPLPTSDDMKIVQLDLCRPISMRNAIFPEMMQYMLIFSEAVDLLNASKSAEDIADSNRAEDGLRSVEKKLMQQYRLLDHQLQFNAANYKEASHDGHAGIFLMLHQYLHTITVLSMKKTQQCSNTGAQVDRKKRATLVACQKIIQILNVAEMIDDKGYTSTPFLTHCIFVAASTILDEASAGGGGHGTEHDFLNRMEDADVEYLCQKLREMGRYFYGLTATLEAIERRRRSSEGAGGCLGSEEVSDHERHGVVELNDGGVVNRYTIH
ncbi:fungal-specific transcription factor domain-containing protein [Dactylonectria macrodidyma]|uniref:Fungal-specific transcription factor domain-containing protein n=1 Tax=Dactylonectria macrodidyma TaxID=307937 RepID=A0A9P9EBU5_9HYPO|nr:fungal-specific transcription factor domain-containing protein [Dactylonectria macrodidyma]